MVGSIQNFRQHILIQSQEPCIPYNPATNFKIILQFTLDRAIKSILFQLSSATPR